MQVFLGTYTSDIGVSHQNTDADGTIPNRHEYLLPTIPCRNNEIFCPAMDTPTSACGDENISRCRQFCPGPARPPGRRASGTGVVLEIFCMTGQACG